MSEWLIALIATALSSPVIVALVNRSKPKAEPVTTSEAERAVRDAEREEDIKQLRAKIVQLLNWNSESQRDMTQLRLDFDTLKRELDARMTEIEIIHTHVLDLRATHPAPGPWPVTYPARLPREKGTPNA